MSHLTKKAIKIPETADYGSLGLRGIYYFINKLKQCQICGDRVR